jgi:pilus assembly protein CpaF
LVRRRASIIISGGTGTGKTTLLRALLNECDETERVVAVEEIREIGGSLRGNFVSLASREKNVENAGEVTLAQLVSATLRMRPDRILLGECRGAEVADILRAFNTGHRGGMTTIHANGVDSLPRRLVALGQLSGLSAQGLSALTVGAFDVVLHLERPAQGGGLGRRRLAQIGSIGEDFYGGGTEEGLMSVPRGHVLSSWDGTRAPTVFPGWEGFAERWNL